jgi:hypothetical protein
VDQLLAQLTDGTQGIVLVVKALKRQKELESSNRNRKDDDWMDPYSRRRCRAFLGLVLSTSAACTNAAAPVVAPRTVPTSIGSFAVGCPGGWTSSDQGAGRVVFMPPRPLPGGIDSFIVAQSAPAEAFAPTGSTPDGQQLLRDVELQLHAQGVVEGSGQWHGGAPAVWFRGLIRGRGLTRANDPLGLDGFVLISPLSSAARIFLVASYPVGTYGSAFEEVIQGLTPDSALPSDVRSGKCAGAFTSVNPPPVQHVADFIVRFNTSPTVNVTDTVTCRPARPEHPGCYLLAAINEVSSVGDQSYRLGIWPTATDEQVAQLRSILQHSSYVASFRTEAR